MTRRNAWSAMADEWDPERDPAQIRMREALALQPPLSPSRKPRDRRSPSRWRPEPAEPAPDPRRGRIAELVARVQAGDLSAVEMLRRLVDR
jgi:hypothetical protein